MVASSAAFIRLLRREKDICEAAVFDILKLVCQCFTKIMNKL